MKECVLHLCVSHHFCKPRQYSSCRKKLTKFDGKLLVNFVNRIVIMIGKVFRGILLIVFLDLKWHSILLTNIILKKIAIYGIKGNAYRRHESYLSNKTQYCCVNGKLSSSAIMKQAYLIRFMFRPTIIPYLHK